MAREPKTPPRLTRSQVQYLFALLRPRSDGFKVTDEEIQELFESRYGRPLDNVTLGRVRLSIQALLENGEAYATIYQNEQLIDQLLEVGPRPSVEQHEIERIARDDEKRLREVEEEEELGRPRPLDIPSNELPARRGELRTDDKTLIARRVDHHDRKSIAEQLDISEFHRAARIAARRAFVQGATAAGVAEAAREALAVLSFGLTAQQRAYLGLGAIVAVTVRALFPGEDTEEQTANERLQEDFIRHQIYVLRFATSVSRTVIDLLNGSERQLKELLDRRLGRMAGKPYDRETEERIKKLLKDVRKMRERVMTRAEDQWRSQLRSFSVEEGRYVSNAARSISPVELQIYGPSEATFRALVDATPFEGKVFRGHMDQFRRGDLQRIEAAIRAGLVNGETNDQITRRVIGAATARGRNGATQITRNHAETITRTFVNAVANRAREEVFKDNKDIFSREKYVATLDARTTPRCRALDGKTFKIGEGPTPPQHFNCRSLRVALLGEELAGKRPMKPVTEQRLLREFARQEGLRDIRTRDDLPRGTRGRFDAFAQRRTREMIGRVPASVTYQDFLTRQPRWFQDDVLGRQRAALFRQGGLTLEKFVDRSGRQYTLAELARREREAFLRAGLDPEDYR